MLGLSKLKGEFKWIYYKNTNRHGLEVLVTGTQAEPMHAIIFDTIVDVKKFRDFLCEDFPDFHYGNAIIKKAVDSKHDRCTLYHTTSNAMLRTYVKLSELLEMTRYYIDNINENKDYIANNNLVNNNESENIA